MGDAIEGRTPAALGDLYAIVRAELDQVEDLLRRQLTSIHPFVDTLAKHSFRLGGKRMRPALVLLSGRAVGGCRPDHVVLAATVEMIHTATLVHDDVLDEATLRRHVPTVNSCYNNETSVLLGDYLFSGSLCLVATLDDPFAARAIGDASRMMCEGELRQIASRGDFDLAEGEYFGIIAAKTGALTACCCRLGAHYAGGDSAMVEALTGFGEDLGVAFQIADDLLDLLGDEATVGKSLGTDLVKQKLTLPLIRLLAVADDRTRRAAIETLSCVNGHDRDSLRSWLREGDAIDYARAQARMFIDRAIARLDVVPPGPARDALRDLAEFAIQRQR